MTAWSKCLSIGGAVDGARADGIRAIAVRPTATSEQQLGAYLDLLHWLLQEPQHGTHGHLHLPVANDELRDALGSLEQARKGKVTVAVTVGHTVPDFLAPFIRQRRPQ